MDLFGCRRILDKLDQPIAKDHLPLCHRYRAAHLEAFGADRLFAANDPPPIFPEVECAAQKICTALSLRLLDDLRIGEGRVGRRDDIEDLACGEGYDVLMMPGDAGNPDRRVVPPLLCQQKTLIEAVEGPVLPGLVREPLVLRERLDARRARGIDSGARAVGEEPLPLLGGLLNELGLLVGRQPEVLSPVGIGLAQRKRREAAGQARDRFMKRLVKARWPALHRFRQVSGRNRLVLRHRLHPGSGQQAASG